MEICKTIEPEFVGVGNVLLANGLFGKGDK